MSLRLNEALMTTTNIKLDNTMYSLHKLDVCGKKFKGDVCCSSRMQPTGLIASAHLNKTLTPLERLDVRRQACTAL